MVCRRRYNNIEFIEIILEKTLFPIGQRSFTSPASVMQPFKTQLNGQTVINPYGNYY
jgi:hypothetical protein